MIKSVLADFPLAVEEQRLPGVYHLGFHSKDSYGGTPWLIVREQGGVMVDSPRYSSKLAAAITAALGGAPAYMLLTHEVRHILKCLQTVSLQCRMCFDSACYERPHVASHESLMMSVKAFSLAKVSLPALALINLYTLCCNPLCASQDDIADHAKWAAAFPTMKRIMHSGDIGKYRSVQPGVIEIELSDSTADRYIACDNGGML
jgi:hypothetical protein